MRNIKSFRVFESSNKDISDIFNRFNDYFTVSFEFEIETDDTDNPALDINDIDEETIEEISDIIKSELSPLSNIDIKFIDSLVLMLIEMIENGDNSNILERLENFKDRESEIANYYSKLIVSYLSGSDIEYLKDMCIKYLPRFTKKWNDEIEYIGDSTLKRGIEIKLKDYLVGLDKAVDMIADFFKDLESQSYWKFKDTTGLHINIGSSKKVDWNPIKGLLFLNDFTDSGYTPMAFKNITWRMGNKYCGSLMKYVKDSGIGNHNINISNIEESEIIINNILTKKMEEVGYKSLGFNLYKLKYNYIEFRYVGGIVSRDILIDKLKYFSFIVYLMSNKEYKRKEYLNKLYRFVKDLK